MRQKVFIILFCFIHFFSHSQGEWNNWYFGWFAAMKFVAGNPVPLPASPMFQNGGIIGASVSDSSGNILFYSNGLDIYNRNDIIMPNGSGLLGGLANCQAIVAVPHPGNINQYYIFTVGFSGTPGPIVGLYYSLLDMQLDGGLGDIVPWSKNIPLQMGDSAVNQLTSIRHQNNKFVWVVALRHGINKQYLAYLIDSSGIHEPPVVSNSGLKQPIRAGSFPIRISPLGNYLICSDTAFSEVCSFDKSTGIITPLFTFNPYFLGSSYYRIYGKEFSTDSKYLYVTNQQYNSPVFQYDITSPDSISFMQSQVFIGNEAGVNLQSGPDGKIYLNSYNFLSDSLYRINYPSMEGLGCGYEKNAFCLQGNAHSFCLPQFLQKYKAYIHYSGHCQKDTIRFSGDIWPPPDSIHWDFGDPSSGSSNFSNDSTPSHIYNLPGLYTVELFIRHIDLRTDTSWTTITIDESPNPDLGPDQTICLGDSVTFDAGFCGGCTYDWSNLTTGQLHIGSGQIYSTTEQGLYMVTVTNSFGCTGMDTVMFSLSPPPEITTSPLFTSICSGEPTNIPLTATIPGTEFSWTATGSSPFVTGYSPGTGDTINQVLTNSGSSPETVTYTITPAVGDCVGDSVQYVVTVTPGDSVFVTITSSADSVCEGTAVTVTATAIHGGSSPNYQWFVNGAPVGTNDSVYTYVPASGDQVFCVLTSSEPCTPNNPATSDTIILVVYPLLPVSIAISASANPVCGGTPVTFTAIPVNGGSAPVYQWQVNATNAGMNNAIFTYVPVNGDTVRCILTSSELCATGNPDTSNAIAMAVGEQPDVTFTACFDTITTLNAKPYKLKGGIPLGGSYSGPGVIDGYFYPALAGEGSHQITYSYTNSSLCEASSSLSIINYQFSIAATASPTSATAHPIQPFKSVPNAGWRQISLTALKSRIHSTNVTIAFPKNILLPRPSSLVLRSTNGMNSCVTKIRKRFRASVLRAGMSHPKQIGTSYLPSTREMRLPEDLCFIPDFRDSMRSYPALNTSTGAGTSSISLRCFGAPRLTAHGRRGVTV